MDSRPGLVAIKPLAPFRLADIYALRCFGSLGFALGTVSASQPVPPVEDLARLIASPLTRHILDAFTQGSLRYRLDFVSRGHQRGTVRSVAARAYELCPEILNDARSAPWVINVYPRIPEHSRAPQSESVELCPKFPSDPRFRYRKADVPAASHPPLAACIARLAGRMKHEVVWDPFCGSGSELIERVLTGRVRQVCGTDRNPEAIRIARDNFASAKLSSVRAQFISRDFRDWASVEGLAPESVTLIITNPPMGRRVRIENLERLIGDLFSVAAMVLRPGGRLVLVNPLRIENPHPALKLDFRQTVDLGGFDGRLEKYVKSRSRFAPKSKW